MPIFFKNCIPLFSAISAIILLLSATPLIARAEVAIHLSEVDKNHVEISLDGNEGDSTCLEKTGQMFETRLGSKKISGKVYSQRLNSEVSDEAVYLKAAGMGKGIYMYLPYFIPKGDCANIGFTIKAKHILWDGKWYVENLKFSAAAARRKAIFFTNEEKPITKGATYFDSEIPKDVLKKIEAAFARIDGFYQDVLATTPMRGIGVVAALTRNDGKYTGFGGDSLNIIRMSYDNPKPADILTLDRVMPLTFAHELAHKLQTGKLFDLPTGRYIVEGGADFLKVIVLLNASIIDEEGAREMVLKASAECGKFSDARTLPEKIQQKAFNYREPYDCGMVYYFTAYYSSNLPLWDFVNTFLKAMAGEKIYAPQIDSLCLLFEPTCQNERLNEVMGNKDSYLQQVAWLKSKLVSHSLILTKRKP